MEPTPLKPEKDPFADAASELKSESLKEHKKKLLEQMKLTLKAGDVYLKERTELRRLYDETVAVRESQDKLLSEVRSLINA